MNCAVISKSMKYIELCAPVSDGQREFVVHPLLEIFEFCVPGKAREQVVKMDAGMPLLCH